MGFPGDRGLQMGLQGICRSGIEPVRKMLDGPGYGHGVNACSVHCLSSTLQSEYTVGKVGQGGSQKMSDKLSRSFARFQWRLGILYGLTIGAARSLYMRGPLATLKSIQNRLRVASIGTSASPAPFGGPASHRLYLLFVDTAIPSPDRDSGSVRALKIMQICSELGWTIAFMPDNGQLSPSGAQLLDSRGVTVIGVPGTPRLDTWLHRHGTRVRGVFLARHHVAIRHLHLIRTLTSARIYFDTVDLHHIRLQRKAALQDDPTTLQEAMRVRAEEFSLINSADQTLVVSEAEAAYLRQHGVASGSVTVLSNIHDPAPLDRPFSATAGLLFVGGFQHHPNREAVHWLAKEVMPLLRVQLPGVSVHIVGDIPLEDAANLQTSDFIVHGHVEALDRHLSYARISLAPLLSGAGVKGKINQAMSKGIPVVATSIAAEGMFLQHGHDALVADGAVRYAEEIVRLYNDEQLWSTIVKNGYANIERHFSSAIAKHTLQALVGIPEAMAPDGTTA